MSYNFIYHVILVERSCGRATLESDR